MSWLCFYAGSYTWDLILQWNAKAGHMLDSYFSPLYPSIGLNHQTSTIHTISWNMFTFCCFLNLLFVNDMQIFILLARYMTDWNIPAIIWLGLVVYHRRNFEKYFPFSVFMLHSYIKLLVSHLLSFWRAANVFSCAYILNLARPPHCQIPRQYQQALWYSGMSAIKYVLFWWVYHKLSRHNFMLLTTVLAYSGLRGAMAFALALQSVHDLPGGHGETIFTATTSIVVLTVSSWM